MTDLDSRPSSGRRFRRKPLWVAVAVVAVICVAVGLALFQPWRIFTRNTVDEALPAAAAGQTQVTAPPITTSIATAGEAKVTPAETLAVTESVGAANPAPAEQVAPVEPAATADPALTADPAATADPAPAAETAAAVEPAQEPVQEPAQEPNAAAIEPIVLAAGTFVDGEHATSGTASILQLADGSRFVRLEGFSTSDGPDVHVWLTDQEAGGEWGKYDDGRYVPLGGLKGTDGNQNYPVPADADLTGLSSVVIWCDRFNVAFGSAAVAL